MYDYDGLIERLINYFVGAQYSDEVIQAKAFFFEKTSVAVDDSSDFENRMAQFLDWYLFSRYLSDKRERPIDIAIKLERFAAEQAHLKNLCDHRHSLFQYEKCKNGNLYLLDLFEKKRVVVKNSPWGFFNKEELFEARLIPDGDMYLFTKGICIYPAEGRKQILKASKRYRKKSLIEREDLMLKLIKVRHKYELYRHVQWDAIFATEIHL